MGDGNAAESATYDEDIVHFLVFRHFCVRIPSSVYISSVHSIHASLLQFHIKVPRGSGSVTIVFVLIYEDHITYSGQVRLSEFPKGIVSCSYNLVESTMLYVIPLSVPLFTGGRWSSIGQTPPGR
jgi:hypothetical protein